MMMMTINDNNGSKFECDIWPFVHCHWAYFMPGLCEVVTLTLRASKHRGSLQVSWVIVYQILMSAAFRFRVSSVNRKDRRNKA